MKKLFSTLFICFIAVYTFAATNFLDLAKSTTRQSQWVQQFDNNTKKGGGFFKYYNTSNVAIQNIAGYQIKVSGSTTGYYTRVDPVNQFNVAWCGAQNVISPSTLSLLGWTQGAADAMWGAGIVNVTTDTYDRAAWAYAMKLMETKGFQCINGEPLDYWVNPSDIILPDYFGTSPYEENLMMINYNGARFFATSNSASHTFFFRAPSSNSDALIYYNRSKIIMTNGTFIGKGSADGIKIGASYGCEISNCHFDSLDTGIELKFCLNPTIAYNTFIRCSNPIYATDGTWSGASTCNSQSNVAYIFKNRIYCKEAAGQTFAGIRVTGASGLLCMQNIIEGGNPQYNIYYDNLSATCVKNGYIGYEHHENTPTVANIYVRAFGLFHVEDVFTQTASTLVSHVSAGGYPQIKVSNIGSLPAGTKFRCDNTGTTWIFDQMRDIDPALDASWDLTSGGIKPAVGGGNPRQYDNFYGMIR